MLSPTKMIEPPLAAGLAVFLALPIFAWAQVAAPPRGIAASPVEEVITLSPFQIDVSQDVGYRSTNSTSGTSLNTPIKDLPMSIEVINEEFISDIGATNFREALQYSSGVFTEQFTQGTAGSAQSNGKGVNQTQSADASASSRSGLGGRFDNGTVIRGFNVSFQNREGFRYGGIIANYGVVLGGIIDTSNVSRMEVVRGPNSLLYGIGVLSGIVNVVAKRPLSAPAQAASFGVGSEGYWRGTLETTGPLKRNLWGGSLNYRVGLAREHRDSWTDFAESDKSYYSASVQFQNARWNVFVEGQYAEQEARGIGPQFIYDNTAAAIDPNFRNEFFEQINWQKDLGGLPQSHRISGPDTYDRREERNLLATVDFTPVENLTISAGAFFTRAEEERFDMDLASLTNENAFFQLKTTLVARANDPATAPAIAAATRDFLDQYVTAFPFTGTPLPGERRNLTDYRTVRYWWRKTPETTSTEQYRLRATYAFETGDFLGDAPARHTFLIGRHDIKDQADVVTAGESINNQFVTRGELASDDPLLFRSIFDQTPIRYNGEPLAQPGTDFRHLDVWYTGHFALYQGWFMNDRLGVIAGLRHDRYHSRDRLYDRWEEPTFNPDQPRHNPPAGIITRNPDNETFGFLPLPLGQEPDEYRPGAEPETAVTRTLALNFRLTDGLTVYGMRGEGITPNTGALDGNGVGISSEQSVSNELGLKFDLVEGKLSGTISVYRITRKNAIWSTDFAPAPINWVGGNDPSGAPPRARDGSFDPTQITPETPLNYPVNNYYFARDGVELGPVQRLVYDDAGNVIGRETAFPAGYLGRRQFFGGDLFPQTYNYFDYALLDEPVIDRNGNATGKTWRNYLEEAFADLSRGTRGFSAVSGPEDFEPIVYEKELGGFLGNNPSLRSATGANTTFTDEATGFDVQLIYQPTPRLQFVFNYAHTEREAVSPFKLAELLDPDTGQRFGTEYDAWVRALGREAFGLQEHDDNGDGIPDRVTKIGSDETLQVGDVAASDLVGGLQGTSLFTGSEDSASVFTKYTFTDGVLKGFAPNLGVTYVGPAATSLKVGGRDLASNLFGTPPTPERYIVNLGGRYDWRTRHATYSLQLNIGNLLDDQKGERVVTYTDPQSGGNVPRRTEVFYGPRSYRLALSVQF